MASSLLKADISQTFGQTFIDDIFLQRSRYYYTVGRSYPWPNDLSPEDVIDSEKYDKLARRDILFAKQIQGTSVSFIVDRYNYQPNISYEKYDDAISMESKKFYVLNTDFNVYKCIDNNSGGISTESPYGTSPSPVRLSDNYVWQFIYTIPPSLRAKFLSDEYMPVYNAITEKYYSRGTISETRINAGGSGYAPETTEIITSGDGYLADNPYRITNLVRNSNGSGYSTPPSVETTDQFDNYVSFTNNLAVIKGQYLKVSDSAGIRFYEVISAGVTSSVTPTHYYTSVSNGTAVLKHAGTKPKITATINDTIIGSARIIDQGFGYTAVPTVTKVGTGTGSDLSANLVGDKVGSISVISGGLNHDNGQLTISAPFPAALVLPSNTAVALNSIYYYNISGSTYFYKVDVAGTTAVSGPTHTTGSTANGTAVLTVVGKTAQAEAILGVVTGLVQHFDVFDFRIIDGGEDYVDGTTEVVFSGGDPDIPATATAVVQSGKVIDIIPGFPGYGYKTPPTVTINGEGTGASANAIMQSGYGYRTNTILLNFSEPDDVNGEIAVGYANSQKTEAILLPIIINGIIRGVKVVDGGVGYTQAILTVNGVGTGAQIIPIFASSELNTIQAQSELLSTAGTLSSVVMENLGDNITSLNVTLQGDGSGAEVNPIVVDGQLIRLDVTDIGQNYTYLDINIQVNPGADVPVARAVIAPALGHGSNPIKELYSKAIALNVTLGAENNNGFEINNSFRQISVLKSPLLFGKSKLLESLTGSACLVANISLGSVPLTKNAVLINQTDNSQYRVIDFDSTKMLLQQITNGQLSPGNLLKLTINNIDYTINVSQISTPEFDKNTGDILYIDNQIAFSPSLNQSVNIITTISLT